MRILPEPPSNHSLGVRELPLRTCIPQVKRYFVTKLQWLVLRICCLSPGSDKMQSLLIKVFFKKAHKQLKANMKNEHMTLMVSCFDSMFLHGFSLVLPKPIPPISPICNRSGRSGGLRLHPELQSLHQASVRHLSAGE